MKRFFLLPILFVSAMMLLADFNEALTYFNATTDKPAVSYKAGDKVVFTFNFGEMNKDIPEGTVISWVREGDDQVFANGDLVWRHDEPVTLETSIGCPGFVHIFAKLKDAATGNDIKFENGNAVTLDCGAGAEPEKLIAAPEPRDFDEYWQKQKEKLAKCPMELLEKKEVLRNNGVVVYAVKISCAPPRPVTGFLGIPENAAEKSLPVYCYYDGYSSHKDIFQQIPKWFANDKISFAVNAHGADLLQDDEYYEQFNKEIKSGDYGYAFDPKQNLSPDTAYFHGMVMRLLRAAEFAKTLPEWDGKTLVACGSSQGGLQSVWAAALDHDFTSAYPTVPWQCDVGGEDAFNRLSGPWRIPYVPGLKYFDCVYMARRITCPVEIPRAGLGDYICPPSGIALLYNNLKYPKKINWYQGSNHGFVPRIPETFTFEEP